MGQREKKKEKKNRVGWEMKNGFSTFKSLRSGSRLKRKKKKIKEKSFGGKKRQEMKNWGKFCAAIKKIWGEVYSEVLWNMSMQHID